MSGGRPTALAGVMGWPVGHSRSPLLHGHWLRVHDIDGAYLPLAVAPDALGAAVNGLRALGFRGANVTVPHKLAVMPYLDRIDAAARAIGAVNTLVIADDGTIEGRNTDAYGFIESLRAGSPGWTPAAGPAVVLGAGGAARAVCWALAQAGVPEIRLCNRSHDKAGALAADLGAPLQPWGWQQRGAALSGAVLVVNTTVLGMDGQPPLDLPLDTLPAAATVVDIVYTPLETPLLAAARARGNTTVDGLGMLLHQAVPGFEAWFGVRPAVDPALRRAVLGEWGALC